MSFSFSLTGTKRGILREIDNVQVSGDTSQADAAKALIKNEIEQLPDDYKPLIAVNVMGHHDPNNRNLTIEIKPVYTTLALDEDPAAAMIEEANEPAV